MDHHSHSQVNLSEDEFSDQSDDQCEHQNLLEKPQQDKEYLDKKQTLEKRLEDPDMEFFKDYCTKQFTVQLGGEFKVMQGVMQTYEEEQLKEKMRPENYEKAQKAYLKRTKEEDFLKNTEKNRLLSENMSQVSDQDLEKISENLKIQKPDQVEEVEEDVTIRIQNYATLASQARAYIQMNTEELDMMDDEENHIPNNELVKFIGKITQSTISKHELALPKCYLDWSVCFVVTKDGRFMYQGLNNGNIRCFDLHDTCAMQNCDPEKGSSNLKGNKKNEKKRVQKQNNFIEFQAHHDLKHQQYYQVTCLALSHDDHYLYSGSEDKTIKIWDLNDPKLFKTLKPEDRKLICEKQETDDHTAFINVDPNIEINRKKQLRNSQLQGLANLVKMHSCDNPVQVLYGHTAQVNCLAVSSDSKYLYSGSNDASVLRWNLEENQPKAEIFKRQQTNVFASILNVTKAPNARKSIAIQQEEAKQELQYKFLEFKGHGGPIRSIALSKKGDSFYSGAADPKKPAEGQKVSNLIKWTILNNSSQDKQNKKRYEKEEINLKYHIHEINSLALQEDEKTNSQVLYIASDMKNIIKYNIGMQMGKDPTELLKGHKGSVLTLSISKNGLYLFSGSSDSSIIQWNTRTFVSTKEDQHIDSVTQVSLSEDQKNVYSISRDLTTRTWGVKTVDTMRKTEEEEEQIQAQRQEAIKKNPILQFFVNQVQKDYLDEDTSHEIFSEQMDKYFCQTHNPKKNAKDRYELEKDQKDKVQKIARGLVQSRFREFSFQALRSIVLALRGLPSKYNLHKMELDYINIPELMIISNQSEKMIMKLLENPEQSYLSKEMNIEQQQTWALNVAIDNKKVELVNSILAYYIKNPSNYKIKVLDNCIMTKLIDSNEPLTSDFLEMIRRKQPKNDPSFTRATILNGRDETIIEHSLNKKLQITVKQELDDKTQEKLKNGQIKEKDIEELKYHNLKKKVDNTDLEFGKEVVLYSLSYSKVHQIGEVEFVALYRALQDSLKNVILLFKTEIYDEYDRFSFSHKCKAVSMWIWTALCYIHLNWLPDAFWMVYPIIFVNFLWLLYEVRMLQVRKWEHFNNGSTAINLYLIVMVIPLIFSNNKDNQKGSMIEINSLTLVLMNLQSLYYLNAFEGTRYLIAMIQAVFKDFVPFFTIFISFILSFSQLDYYQNRLDLTRTQKYLDILQNNYMIALGQIDIDNKEMTIRRIFLILYTLILTVILMNLLISVISDTYSTFSQSQEEYNLRQLLNIIVQMHQFYKTKRDLVKWEPIAQKMGGFVLTDDYKSNYKVPGLIKYRMVEQKRTNRTLDQIHQLSHRVDHSTHDIMSKIESESKKRDKSIEGLAQTINSLVVKFDSFNNDLQRIKTKIDGPNETFE